MKASLLILLAVLAPVIVYVALNPNNQKTNELQEIKAHQADSTQESVPITTAIPETITTEVSADAETRAAEIQTFEKANYSLYVPEGLDYNVSHPAVIAFSPSADALSMIRAWKNVADRHQWIVYASKTFQNGPDPGFDFRDVISDLESLEKQYPINSSRIIVTGFSGGAQGSHMFAYYCPKYVWAIVLNTGMIKEIFYQNDTYRYYYPKNKTAVFIASPTDFRYEAMKKDKIMLDGLGWRTKWIEFTGGHTIAPEETYQEAARWLEDRMNTSRDPKGLVLGNEDVNAG